MLRRNLLLLLDSIRYINFVNYRTTIRYYKHAFCDVRRPNILLAAPKMYKDKPRTDKAYIVDKTVMMYVCNMAYETEVKL